ncbi:hypothetical protein PpBr36_05500 [Pyricularia pennisetigena]|uniref:hypothetical protein n=1 Tax=Pyricularia pennisetigena TaxID=1578925 RepID=UPI00114DFA57|nr:hypothetical protein PpBr36_05500 [Pyricularia pennisetigena]TLS27230.1 hypothetical protein PpBr36_05500 [Pyricularia pennisetigena]
MASALFFLDLKGKTLLARNYRGDIPMSAVEKFPILLSEAEEESSAVPPCFSHEGINYLYIRHNNLYLLALTKRNTNAAEILLFLHKIVEVFTEYFKALEEESIRDNFVIIYELLDEMMDFGYPQTTESKILQEYITQESHKLEIQARPPIAVTNAVSWRSEGIRYRKNEVFLDVVESLNLLVSSNGNVLRSEILGAIKMKCYLSGMPELRLGLNDKVMFETTGRTTRGKAIEMEDVKFHQCVRLSRFENDRTISFIPPDGEFELMSYRLNTQVKPLIWVECVVESHSGSRIEYMLKAKAQFKRRSTANNVEIVVPVPDDADTPRFRTNIGSVHYAPEQSAIVWKIKQFGGGKEFLMRAELGLPSVRGDDEHGGGMTGGFGGSMGGVGGPGKGGKRPIQVKFEIPYFTTSGIQVRYLKITEPKQAAMSRPWHLRKTPKVYYCVDFPQDDLPDGPFDVVTGRGLQPVLPFPGDGPEQNYRVDLAAPVVTVPFQTRELSLRQRPAQLGSEASAPNDLDRFVQAQSNNCYETALEEMRAGAKRSHWMWYIFPQLAGVAARPSLTSARYAVRDLAEAVEFLRHPVLGRRLREMVAVVAGSEAGTAVALMGSQVDVLKLQSCMTLFRRAERVLYGRGYALTREDEYWAVLKKYYNEEECNKTVQILG